MFVIDFVILVMVIWCIWVEVWIVFVEIVLVDFFLEFDEYEKDYQVEIEFLVFEFVWVAYYKVIFMDF